MFPLASRSVPPARSRAGSRRFQTTRSSRLPSMQRSRRFQEAVGKARRQGSQAAAQGRRALPETGAGRVGPAPGRAWRHDGIDAARGWRGDPGFATSPATPKPRSRRRLANSYATCRRSENAYLASRAQDVREVGDRILRHLTDTPLRSLLPHGSHGTALSSLRN